LLFSRFCKVASTFAWQPSDNSIVLGVGAGHEFVLVQSVAIVTVFGYVATGAALTELRAGIFTSTGVATGVAVGAGVDVGFAAGDAAGDPLSHSNFFPFFTQVNFFPPAIDVWPTLVHAVPAFTAAGADEGKARETAIARTIDVRDFFT
jgi:hypothetical protein